AGKKAWSHVELGFRFECNHMSRPAITSCAARLCGRNNDQPSMLGDTIYSLRHARETAIRFLRSDSSATRSKSENCGMRPVLTQEPKPIIWSRSLGHCGDMAR